MSDIDPTAPMPEPTPAPSRTQPAPEPNKPHYSIVDGVVLFALLGMCAAVYRIAGHAGFSVITGAVAALYGTWRLRR
ncbi:hypothetical protein M2161_009266 [Streptomyces sp. SAI-133]|uniref:hypothetical protein n=1 Tax=unclassified Streptomyces TaxID=2593676 RepID=UPI002476B764|nr:hypothetical protein [Streptomyces sp. SAI-133]MDH6590075.1 hypothetical protein [Streptomyces sp. SAI-133]